MEIFANADPLWIAGLIAAMVVTGLVAGTLAGLLGVGGGIVIVPVLFHLFTLLEIDDSVRMHVAVGTSLATIVPTSIASMRAHFKRGSVDKDLLKEWGVWILVGAVAGAFFFGVAKSEWLTAIFATVAIIVAANMAFRREGFTIADSLPGRAAQWTIATVVGAFSMLMGIGGGTLTVPILSLFSYPIRMAVGTASAIGLFIAVPGTIGAIISGIGVPNLPPLNVGYVHILGFFLILPLTVFTAPVGARIAHAINPELLRKAFALFLFLTSIRMYYSLFNG